MIQDFINNTIPEIQQHLTQLGISFSRTGTIWMVINILIILLSVFLARKIGKSLQRVLDPQLRKIHGRPKLLRVLATFKRRSAVAVFCLMLWVCVFILKQITWPSNGFTLTIIASLATAWLLIELATKVIRNRLIGKLVAYLIWFLAALKILNVLPDALAVLNKTSIDIGSFHSTVMSLLKGGLIFVAAIWLAMAIGRFTENELNKSNDLSPSLKVLSAKLLKALFVLIALLIGMSALGIDFTALAVLSGAIGLGIGFGLQKIFANLISGVILLLDKSIKPGDVITVASSINESFGQINYLAARYVSVVARDGREYLIPNEDLIINQVINWSYSDEFVRQDIYFGTSYDSDPYLVRQLAIKAAALHPRVVTDKKPVCHVVEFGDSAIRYILRFWIIDPEGGTTNVKGDIYLSLWDLFKDNNVKIPFPHRRLIIDTESERSSGPGTIA